MTHSTSAKTLGFYVGLKPGDDAAPLNQLEERYGSRLEGIQTAHKLALLATITANLCDCYEVEGVAPTLEQTYFALPLSIELPAEFQEVMQWLDPLKVSDLLGLCEAIVAQLKGEVY